MVSVLCLFQQEGLRVWVFSVLPGSSSPGSQIFPERMQPHTSATSSLNSLTSFRDAGHADKVLRSHAPSSPEPGHICTLASAAALQTFLGRSGLFHIDTPFHSLLAFVTCTPQLAVTHDLGCPSSAISVGRPCPSQPRPRHEGPCCAPLCPCRSEHTTCFVTVTCLLLFS